MKIYKSSTSNVLAAAILVILMAGVWNANAQTSVSEIIKSDPRVAKALKETNTDFELSSKEGVYKVTYETKGKRTQEARVSSVTEQINGTEMRLVFSFASISKSSPSQQVANMLLQENMERIGNWGLLKMDDGMFAILIKMYIPATGSGKLLEEALMIVALTADEMEEKLTSKDVN